MGFKIIAIDGPAGSGKSTISRLVANRIGFVYVKTGEMFRSITYMLIKNSVDIEDVEAVKKVLSNLDLRFEYNKEQQISILEGENITKILTTKEVTKLVSQVSTIKEVRDKVFEYEHSIAKQYDIVMEGRDIGTVVFPNADLKIFLDASVEERSKRGYAQALDEGQIVSYEEIMNSIILRDELDRNKKYGALKIPDDAIVVNSDNSTIENTVNRIVDIIKEKLKI